MCKKGKISPTMEGHTPRSLKALHSAQGTQAVMRHLNEACGALWCDYLQEAFTALQDKAVAVRTDSPGRKRCVCQTFLLIFSSPVGTPQQ